MVERSVSVGIIVMMFPWLEGSIHEKKLYELYSNLWVLCWLASIGFRLDIKVNSVVLRSCKGLQFSLSPLAN